MVFFRRRFRTSLSISEKMIGIGKVASEYSVMVSVLRISYQKIGRFTNLMNHFSPTHSLPRMPLLVRKFLNAI